MWSLCLHALISLHQSTYENEPKNFLDLSYKYWISRFNTMDGLQVNLYKYDYIVNGHLVWTLLLTF